MQKAMFEEMRVQLKDLTSLEKKPGQIVSPKAVQHELNDDLLRGFSDVK